VFEPLREEDLHDPKGCYAVFDLYFVEPGDESGEVILHFGQGPHGPTRDVGGVRVDLPSGDVEMMPAHASAKLLRYLWGRYRRRYPDLSHLEARRSRLQEVGIELRSKGA
jgi:hypothetical protein